MTPQKQAKLTLTRLPQSKTLVIKQEEPNTAFIATKDSIVISMDVLIILFNYLVKNEFVSRKVITGMLEELHTL